MDQTLALITISHYVCAICWSDLEWTPYDDVICTKYGVEHQGYVTRTYVERRKQEDKGDLLEARHLLKQVGIIPDPHKGKSAEQLLHELGF